MELVHEELTQSVIGAAIEVHRTTGPGLLESSYETASCHELTLRGIPFLRQILCPLLRLTRKPVGLLVNVRLLKDGIIRRVL